MIRTLRVETLIGSPLRRGAAVAPARAPVFPPSLSEQRHTLRSVARNSTAVQVRLTPQCGTSISGTTVAGVTAKLKCTAGLPGYPNNPSQCRTTFITSTSPVYHRWQRASCHPAQKRQWDLDFRPHEYGRQAKLSGRYSRGQHSASQHDKPPGPMAGILDSRQQHHHRPMADLRRSRQINLWRPVLHEITERVRQGTTLPSIRRRPEELESESGIPSRADKQRTRPSTRTGSSGRKTRYSSSLTTHLSPSSL